MGITDKPALMGGVCYSTSVQFSSVAVSCLTLCNPMDCSTPGLHVHYQLPEFFKLMSIEVVMPSNRFILYQPLLLLHSIFPNIRVFSNESALHISIGVYLQHSSFQESSSTPQFKSINSSMLSLLYSPTLTCIHDYWKNHSFD